MPESLEQIAHYEQYDPARQREAVLARAVLELRGDLRRSESDHHLHLSNQNHKFEQMIKALSESLEHPIAGNRIDALEGAVKLLEQDRRDLLDQLRALESRLGSGGAPETDHVAGCKQPWKPYPACTCAEILKQRASPRMVNIYERYVEIRDERDAAQAALARYGRHGQLCGRYDVAPFDALGPCTCGLADALGGDA